FEVMAAHAASRGGAARAMLRIARASGADGMIGGQTADIIHEGKPADEGVLAYIQANKTGALFCAAAVAGAILAGADDHAVGKLDECIQKLGTAFQIKDDILDLTSTDAELGKPTGSDARNQKLTYPAIFGLEKAQADFERLSSQAFTEAGELFGDAAEPLLELIKQVTGRTF
ncbi:MAG: polyprenyl synthetase family protein, partial [Defluviitaleaceae bacterium]|nr:polyprenyl synthetase family protein [Defluviitaleaceae bacterium]